MVDVFDWRTTTRMIFFLFKNRQFLFKLQIKMIHYIGFDFASILYDCLLNAT